MRLIDADALKKDLQESYKRLQEIYNGLHYDDERQICAGQLTSFTECILRIKEAPTIEAEPVKHGRWIKPTKINGRSFSIVQCSMCGGVPCGVDENTRYCPNCGAKMDLEEK